MGLRRRQQRVRPGDDPLRVAAPVAVERPLHEALVEAVALLEDAREVDLGGLGGVVGSLPGDRVVEDDGIGQPEHGRARGEPRDGPAHGRCEPAGQNALCVGQLHGAAALRLPRQEPLEDLQRAREVRGRRGDIGPAVQRAAGNPLEDHDLARAPRRQGREDEVLADTGDQVEADGRVLWPRRHALDVGQGERALRRVVGRLLGVAGEEVPERPLPGRDDDEVVRPGVVLELVDPRLADHELAAALYELVQPRRDLEPLVDRLRRPVEPRRPVDRLRAVGSRHRQRDPLDRRALVAPAVEPESALALERALEHALARHDPSRSDLLGRPVRGQRHLGAGGEQAEPELEPGLPRADDRDSHGATRRPLPGSGSPCRGP